MPKHWGREKHVFISYYSWMQNSDGFSNKWKKNEEGKGTTRKYLKRYFNLIIGKTFFITWHKDYKSQSRKTGINFKPTKFLN